MKDKLNRRNEWVVMILCHLVFDVIAWFILDQKVLHDPNIKLADAICGVIVIHAVPVSYFSVLVVILIESFAVREDPLLHETDSRNEPWRESL